MKLLNKLLVGFDKETFLRNQTFVPIVYCLLYQSVATTFTLSNLPSGNIPWT